MNTIHTKQCEYCGKEFVPNPRSRVVQKYCGQGCSNKASAKRVWAREKTPKILASIKEKVCPICGTKFFPHIRNHSKQKYCSHRCLIKVTTRKNLVKRVFSRENKYKDFKTFISVNELNQVYNNNRSALVRYFYKELLERQDEVGKITVAEWREIKDKYGNSCALCGKKESPDEVLTIDHIVPISAKGKNTKDNIRPLCSKCNTNKSKMDSIHTPSIPN